MPALAEPGLGEVGLGHSFYLNPTGQHSAWGNASSVGGAGLFPVIPLSSAIIANRRSLIFALAENRGIKGAKPFGSSSFLSDVFSSVEEEKMPS